MTYIAIDKQCLIGQGELIDLIKLVKTNYVNAEPYIFELATCKRIDIDWHGDTDSVIQRLDADYSINAKKRGRPKLGVTSKEVTLLPKHWEWLRTQRGGASMALRRLIDQAMDTMTLKERIRLQQDQLYNLMTVCSDAAGFEEASRALYRCDKSGFEVAISGWSGPLKEIMLDKLNAMLALQGNDND